MFVVVQYFTEMQKLSPELARVSFSSFDDILSSLDDLEVKVKSPPPRSHTTKLRSQIGAPLSPPLGSSANVCGKCRLEIGAEKITADGKYWHPQCFTCHTCGRSLNSTFFPKGGVHYCVVCVEKQNLCTFCNKTIPVNTKYSIDGDGNNYHMECMSKKKTCSKCNLPITDIEVKALDKLFHPLCFTCTNCNKHLEGSFVNVGGNPVCQSCRTGSKPKCGACGQPILKNFTEFNGLLLHSECFVCFKCKVEIGLTPFYNVGGKPICKLCGVV